MLNCKSKYDFERVIEELLDDALNILSPDSFRELLDSISMILVDYEEAKDVELYEGG